MKYRFIYILIALSFINGAIWSSPVFSKMPIENSATVLSVYFLDVGQGDAIYIETPSGNSMLVDGGPEDVVIEKLREIKNDSSIDVVVATNPDADHISGLSSVLSKYTVGVIFEPGTTNTTKTYTNLELMIAQERIPKLIAEKGTIIMLDEKEKIYFEILFPDRDVSGWERNDGSIVGRLVYGHTSFMLTGDATTTTENAIMLRTLKEKLSATILKLGHHGSRTSSSLAWLQAVNPQEVIISSGKDNRYGHPHSEITDRLDRLGIVYLNTATEGTISYESDGIIIRRK